MAVIHANSSNFDDLIHSEYVLVDFFANWCGPCKMLGPVLESVSNSRSNVKIVKVDIDENEDLARKFGVMTIPTMILFKNGQEINKHVGFMAEPVLNNWINDNVN